MIQDYEGEATLGETENQMLLEQQQQDDVMVQVPQQQQNDQEQSEELDDEEGEDTTLAAFERQDHVAEINKSLHALTSRGDSGMLLGRTPHTRHYNRVRFQQG